MSSSDRNPVQFVDLVEPGFISICNLHVLITISHLIITTDVYIFLFQHPFSTIKKMAEFIDVSYTDGIIREIIEKCSFVNIKQHKYDSSRMIDPKHKSTLFRKGNFITIDKSDILHVFLFLYWVTVI